WVFHNQEHFIAAPVPHDDQAFVSGLGAFNVSTLYCLSADPKAARRPFWTKSTPYLKPPEVSSPALSGSRLRCGDGMHQRDGGLRHGLRLAGGMPLWQLPVPGTLVHLEGSPTVVDGRAYIVGGAAGVLCVDTDRVTLDGKELDLTAVQKL